MSNLRFTKYREFTRKDFPEECLRDITHQDSDWEIIEKWINKLGFSCNTITAFNYLKSCTYINENKLVDKFGNPDKEIVEKFMFLIIVDSVNFYGIFRVEDSKTAYR